MCIGSLKPEASPSQDETPEHCKPRGKDDQRIGETAERGNFDCSICLDSTQDPIVTLCGHLFCWSCLYRWLEMHSSSKECPVCKSHVDEKRIIPLYGRGRTSLPDPGKKPPLGMTIPARPPGFSGEHSPRVATGSRSGGGSPRIYHGGPHGGVHHTLFSPGFGRFPSSSLGVEMTGPHNGRHFGFSGSAFSTSMGAQGNVFHSRRFYQQQQEGFLHWVFVLLACFTMACLLFS